MDSTAALKDHILALEIALRQVLAWAIELQSETNLDVVHEGIWEIELECRLQLPLDMIDEAVAAAAQHVDEVESAS